MNQNRYQPNPQGCQNGGCGPRPGAQPYPGPYGTQPYQSAPRPQSRFTGGLLGLIGINIAQWLIIFFTLGLATPWAVCLKANWLTAHTIVDGRQLYFDGTGGQLFGNYIKWFFLTLITLGIYGFWVSIKMRQWVTMHTHMR